MLRPSFLSLLFALTFFACSGDVDGPNLKPCDEALNHNRSVDIATAKIPYMKTCGLSLSTSKFLRDVYTADITVDQAYLDTIYDELEVTDRLLDKHQIPYFIESGTLIGAIRNGGLIPNDDDADIAMEIKYEQQLVKLGPEFDQLGYNLEEVPFLGYKVKKKNTNSNGLDIFLRTIRSENGKEMLVYARPGSYANWPNTGFALSSVNNIKKIPFGHLQLSSVSLQDSIDYLDRAYGSDWYTVTYKTADHVTRRPVKPHKEKLLPNEYYHLVHSKKVQIGE